MVPKLIVVFPPYVLFPPKIKIPLLAPIIAPPSLRSQPSFIRPPGPLMFPLIVHELELSVNMLSLVAPTPDNTQLRVAGEVMVAVVPTAAPLVVFSTAPPATVTVPVAAPKAASVAPEGQRNSPI